MTPFGIYFLYQTFTPTIYCFFTGCAGIRLINAKVKFYEINPPSLPFALHEVPPFRNLLLHLHHNHVFLGQYAVLT